jgi:hypothetical protein
VRLAFPDHVLRAGWRRPDQFADRDAGGQQGAPRAKSVEGIGQHRRAFYLIPLLWVLGTPAIAATRTVDDSGGKDHLTIAACITAAQAGDFCDIYAGTYNENVATARAGALGSRITFRGVEANVVFTGTFTINHAYITISGIDGMVGSSTAFTNIVTVGLNGSNCEILDNTFRDGATNVQGIAMTLSTGDTPANCLIQGNTMTNLNRYYITLSGLSHIVEDNTLGTMNSRDYFRPFGKSHIIRRNLLGPGSENLPSGDHADFAQIFGGANTRSEDILFEENFMWDGGPIQVVNLTNGPVPITATPLQTNIKNWTFRRNVFVNMEYNTNSGIPGVTWDHNTFYKNATDSTAKGISISNSITRSSTENFTATSNVFLGGGFNTGATIGYYSYNGTQFTLEQICIWVTGEPNTAGLRPNCDAIQADLDLNNYITPDGILLAAAMALTGSGSAEMTFDPALAAFKEDTYTYLMQSVDLENNSISTFTADYNYVAGSVAGGFLPKTATGCAGVTTQERFCESNGINGGDPTLISYTDFFGADDLPFTADDGLKPQPGSILCNAGENGTTIGAYSCHPSRVFVDEDTVTGPVRLRIRP